MNLETHDMSCILENNRLAIYFNKYAKATSLKVDGIELLDNLTGAPNDPDRHNSFYCDYHVSGKTLNLTPTELKIIENNPEFIHIAYIDSISDLKLQYHVILKNNDTAVYSYVIATNDSSDLEINELRTVYRLNSELFNIAYTNERQGVQPKTEHLLKYPKLQDETYEIPDGSLYTNSKIYSKYDFAGYFKDNDFWGQYGKKYGFWFIPIDKSGYPSGPLKQDLLVHYDGILLNYMVGAHFGTDDFKIPHHWSKMYGPWCCYINHDQTDLLKDVKKRVIQEKNASPYAWVHESNDLYPHQLSKLHGSLKLDPSPSLSKPWTIVLSDQQGDYYRQKSGRLYYTNTSENGNFKIENIRPNRYYITAYQNGGIDCKNYDLGIIDIYSPLVERDFKIKINHLKCLWNIGSYTKTTQGFKFSNQLRNYIWKELVPKNLTFNVDQDKDTDWYYLQNNEGIWKIIFDHSSHAAKFLLTFCLAGTTQKDMASTNGVSFQIFLNGKEICLQNFSNDRSAYRSSVTGGSPQQILIELTDQDFSTKNNELSIKTNGYIMYDLIKLEEL